MGPTRSKPRRQALGELRNMQTKASRRQGNTAGAAAAKGRLLPGSFKDKIQSAAIRGSLLPGSPKGQIEPPQGSKDQIELPQSSDDQIEPAVKGSFPPQSPKDQIKLPQSPKDQVELPQGPENQIEPASGLQEPSETDPAATAQLWSRVANCKASLPAYPSDPDSTLYDMGDMAGIYPMDGLRGLLHACHVQDMTVAATVPEKHFSLLTKEHSTTQDAGRKPGDRNAFHGDRAKKPPFITDEERHAFAEEHIELVLYNEPDVEVTANFLRRLFRGDPRSRPDELDSEWRVACRLVPTVGMVRLPILSPKRAAEGVNWQSVAVPQDDGHFCTFSLSSISFSDQDQLDFAAAFGACKNPGFFLSPYLVVHYGAEQQDMENGVVLAGSAALHARVVLREDAEQRRKGERKELRGLRCYGITISRDVLTVSCFVPVLAPGPAQGTRTASSGAGPGTQHSTAPDVAAAPLGLVVPKAGAPPRGQTQDRSAASTAAKTTTTAAGTPVSRPLAVGAMRGDGSHPRRPLWNGCRVEALAGGSSKQKHLLKHLVDWVNAIHAWGTGEHAEALLEDLRAVEKPVPE